MTREIKFRAWDGKHSKMLFWKNIYEANDFWEDVQYPEMLPVMQYTGLKDKRGSEIFEGDVVCGDTSLGNCFEVDMSKYDALAHLQEFSEKDYFIAGNIYQNSDLLTNN